MVGTMFPVGSITVILFLILASVGGTYPDFNPTTRAEHSVRILEISTPSWGTYDSVRHNLPLTDIVPATIRERTSLSPILHTLENWVVFKQPDTADRVCMRRPLAAPQREAR